MQTLGLTDSAPRTEGRLKSLFWLSIKTGNDVPFYVFSIAFLMLDVLGVIIILRRHA